ncbi:MAG: hypothetical protein WD794_08180 [Mycobacteriales bacterium]
MVFDASRAALADAGLTIADIDAVMLSTTDQVEGRVIESMVTNGAAGGVGRDVTTITSAGEHALIYGYLRLRAGQSRRVLVVVWSKESESMDSAHADLLGAEPFLLRPLGMTSVVAAGLQASAYAARHGLEEAVVQGVREASARQTARVHPDLGSTTDGHVAAWPLTDADLPQGCDAACAAVLVVADEVTAEHVPAWISGVGWVTERYDLGGRDLTRFEALEAATEMALGAGGSAASADVVEVQQISSVGLLAALEALGLAPDGKGADVVTRSAPVVNPSGGNLFANPGNAAGVLRLLAAAQQVRGRAGEVQVTPQPTSAVGAALHGLAGQGAAVVAFTSEQGAAA